MATTKHSIFRLGDDTLSLLQACSEAEQATRTDVVRRAVAAYAERLGVASKPKRSRTRARHGA
jgi:hypothetical protein